MEGEEKEEEGKEDLENIRYKTSINKRYKEREN